MCKTKRKLQQKLAICYEAIGYHIDFSNLFVDLTEKYIDDICGGIHTKENEGTIEEQLEKKTKSLEALRFVLLELYDEYYLRFNEDEDEDEDE